MNNRISFLLSVGLLLIASSAHGQALRTWVSATGNDDSFGCSRIDPCQTFAGAIARTAAGGEISVIDPGDYGPVTITKSITIDGGSMYAGILAAGTNAVNVNVTAPSDPGIVILRGLSINGVGTGLDGIRYLAGTRLVVENCSISGFMQSGIDLPSTTVAGTVAQVTNSLITGNTGFGVHADGNGTVSVANSLLANNRVAVQADSLATVRLSNNEIFDNGTGIVGCGSGRVASARNNKEAGNLGGCTPPTRDSINVY